MATLTPYQIVTEANAAYALNPIGIGNLYLREEVDVILAQLKCEIMELRRKCDKEEENMATFVNRTGWFKPAWAIGLRHYTVTGQSQVRERTLLDCRDDRGETLVIDARDFMPTKDEAMAYCRAQAKSAAEHWALQMQMLEDSDGHKNV